ncbi:hypothetical protein KCP77_03605 [Salmonella enterica subsp. enterica]|nr:hypothetical protein KCP77_03605 [Salmonella enterica subsp. enterica]
MKPTFMRWVAIAACWPGTFSGRWPILPSRRQSPMVLKKMFSSRAGDARDGGRWMQWRRRLAWLS